jgi:hypothetical protein
VLGIEAAQSMAEDAGDYFSSDVCARVQTKLDALMFGVRNCRSTLDVQGLARNIAQMLDDEARAEAEPNPEKQGGEGEQPGKGTRPLQQAVDTINKNYGNTDCKAYHDYREMFAKQYAEVFEGVVAATADMRSVPDRMVRDSAVFGGGQGGDQCVAATACRVVAGGNLMSTLSRGDRQAHRHAASLPNRSGRRTDLCARSNGA